jgi:pyruvate/2-oxoglutarate dehydrogenase complex dihydrolipoamide acyltransferase (E2) component
VSWEIAHPSPEQETPPHPGRETGAAFESAPRAAALGPTVAPVAPVPQLTLTTAVEAGELLLFRADLRSTLEAVVVCAAGRALSAHPEVNVTVVERVGRPDLVPATSSWVQLLVLCDDGLRAGTVDAGEARPLTDVRDAVAALVEELRGGRPPQPAEPAALSVSTFALSGAAPSARTQPASSGLAVGRLTGEAEIMQVELSVDARVIDADQASRLLATVVRMLEHPYRRLR